MAFGETLKNIWGDVQDSVKETVGGFFPPPVDGDQSSITENIFQVLYGAVKAGREAFAENVTQQIRESPAGQRIEERATQQKIGEVISSPLGIAVMILAILLVINLIGRR